MGPGILLWLVGVPYGAGNSADAIDRYNGFCCCGKPTRDPKSFPDQRGEFHGYRSERDKAH
jgi:hypothetical protein